MENMGGMSGEDRLEEIPKSWEKERIFGGLRRLRLSH